MRLVHPSCRARRRARPERSAAPPGLVLEVTDVFGLEGHCRRPRAEEAPPEAGTLFVRPVDEPQGHGPPLRGERAEDLQCRDGVEGAVKLATAWYGVHMAPKQDGLFRVTGSGG